jgi:hypothetical protein
MAKTLLRDSAQWRRVEPSVGLSKRSDAKQPPAGTKQSCEDIWGSEVSRYTDKRSSRSNGNLGHDLRKFALKHKNMNKTAAG